MTSKLAKITLNFCQSLAQGFVQCNSNTISFLPIDLSNPNHIATIHSTSIRLTFIILISLHMEENAFLPNNSAFRDKFGIFRIRENWNTSPAKGKKLSFINRIRETIRQIYNGGTDFAPFQARLFDPDELSNKYIFEWKIYDNSINEALNDLFMHFPHPESSLIAFNPPSIDEILDIYSDLLDAELCTTDSHIINTKSHSRIIADQYHLNESPNHQSNPNDQVYYSITRQKSRKKGTVYTSTEIINRVIDRTLSQLITESDANRYLRILDPACGNGRFLKCAVGYLESAYSKLKREIVSNCLYGYDNDEIALSLAEISLMLETHSIHNPSPNLKDNLIVCDALTNTNLNTTYNLFHRVPAFDAVIGNPPYGDILDSKSKTSLIELGYKSGGSGNNDIFRFFVEMGLTRLRPAGMLGFILPNTFLKGRKFVNFRRRITELSFIEEIVDFNLSRKFKRDVFTALLFLKKKPSKRNQTLFITCRNGSFDNITIETFDPEKDSDDSWLPKGQIVSKFLNDNRFMPLDPVFVRIRDAGINYQRKSVGWTERKTSRIASEIFYEGNKLHQTDLPYLKGVDIDRFVVKPQTSRWLRHDWKEKIQEGEVVNVNYRWAQYPIKILTRQTGDSIIAAIDSNNYLTGRSLHTSVLRDPSYSPWYILALLNSDIMSEIYREMTREKGRPQAQVKLSFLRKLPVRKIHFNISQSDRHNLFNKYRATIDINTELLPEIISDLKDSPNQAVAHDLISFTASRIEHILKGNLDSIWEGKKIQKILSTAIGILYDHDPTT